MGVIVSEPVDRLPGERAVVAVDLAVVVDVDLHLLPLEEREPSAR